MRFADEIDLGKFRGYVRRDGIYTNSGVEIDPEFRDILPRLTTDESASLRASVEADPGHLVMPPVVVWVKENDDGDGGAGIIVDGHNQYQIRRELRLTIRYLPIYFDSREEALAHCVRVRLGRRNLSESQRATIVADNAELLAQGRPTSVSSSAAKKTEELARLAGVSKRTQDGANRIVKLGAAPVVDGLKAGKFTVRDAGNIVKLPEPVQAEIVAKAKSDGTTLTKAAGNRISGGTTFDPVELEAAPARKFQNGRAVVDSRLLEKARECVSDLCRKIRALGEEIYYEHDASLSAIIRGLDDLKKQNK